MPSSLIPARPTIPIESRIVEDIERMLLITVVVRCLQQVGDDLSTA